MQTIQVRIPNVSGENEMESKLLVRNFRTFPELEISDIAVSFTGFIHSFIHLPENQNGISGPVEGGGGGSSLPQLTNLPK